MRTNLLPLFYRFAGLQIGKGWLLISCTIFSDGNTTRNFWIFGWYMSSQRLLNNDTSAKILQLWRLDTDYYWFINVGSLFFFLFAITSNHSIKFDISENSVKFSFRFLGSNGLPNSSSVSNDSSRNDFLYHNCHWAGRICMVWICVRFWNIWNTNMNFINSLDFILQSEPSWCSTAACVCSHGHFKYIRNYSRNCQPCVDWIHCRGLGNFFLPFFCSC